MSLIDSGGNTIFTFDSLEMLSLRESPVHALCASTKLFTALFYIAALISFDKCEISSIVSFFLCPVIIVAFADIPYSIIIKRSAVAMPFCIFAGVSTLFFDRNVLFIVYGISVTRGAVIFCSLIIRTLLSVSAVSILIATTHFTELIQAFGVLHIPVFFTSIFEMTYRYIRVIADECSSMILAYKIKSGRKTIRLQDFGTFAGALALRSLTRARRIYIAMQCRGRKIEYVHSENKKLRVNDILFIALVCGSSLLFRFVNIAAVLGAFFQCLM